MGRRRRRVTFHHVDLRVFMRVLTAAEKSFAQAGIMAALSERPGRIVSYAELMTAMYGAHAGPTYPRSTMRVAVGKLRRHGVTIIAHKGRGYSVPEGNGNALAS